jgi:hypothetical protein
VQTGLGIITSYILTYKKRGEIIIAIKKKTFYYLNSDSHLPYRSTPEIHEDIHVLLNSNENITDSGWIVRCFSARDTTAE